MDEKWAFVWKKQRHCDPADPRDAQCGDDWDHVALDPEHRLVLDVLCGKRSGALVRQLLWSVRRRTGDLRLITTDEFRPYREVILDVYGQECPRQWPYRPGQPQHIPKKPPPGLVYATVHKTRRHGRVVKVEPRVKFGTEQMLQDALAASSVSRAVNTSFLERQNATDRHRNSRKVRKTYRFSKDWRMHEAATYFSMFSYNFCWPVRTLRAPTGNPARPCTPAMSAGLTDHLWTIQEWVTFPARCY
jgi:IS1 family transposase